MDIFLYTVFSYPVVVYSVLFIIVLLYWLIFALGLVDLDFLQSDADVDLPSPEVDADLELDLDAGSAESGSDMGLASGFLLWFGLHGIPLTIILSLLSILGWLVSSVIMRFMPSWLTTGIIGAAVGTGVLLVSLFVAAWLTGKLIAPVRRFLAKNREDTSPQSLCGRKATVRSGLITENGGQAVCVKDGYSFIIQVQTMPGDEELRHGDTAYVMEYHPATNSYTIVSERKFRGTW